MNVKWRKSLLAGGTAFVLALGLAGCGSEENNEEQPEKQENNHSDVNEEMDHEDHTGTNQEEQVEIDPNDETK